jgi:hypothetical protein
MSQSSFLYFDLYDLVNAVCCQDVYPDISLHTSFIHTSFLKPLYLDIPYALLPDRFAAAYTYLRTAGVLTVMPLLL